MAIPGIENFAALLDQLVGRKAPAAAGSLDVGAYDTPKPGQVPKAPGGTSSFLKRPGFGALLRTGGVAGLVPTLAGGAAAAAAGGSAGQVLEGADWTMFGRALGEGAARLMLPAETVAAADKMDAGGFIGPGGAQAPGYRGTVVPASQLRPSAAELALQAREDARDAAVRAPYTSPDVGVVQAENSKTADKLLARLDTMVGRNTQPSEGYGANARMRNLASNPGALGVFNEAQRLNRTGIMAERDANGRLYLSNDPGATPRTYTGADGKPTSDWTQTEAYQSAVARASADKAALAQIEGDRRLSEARGAIDRRKTVAGKKLATELYLGELTADTARANTQRLATVEGRKAAIEQAKLGIDALKAQADAGNTQAQAALRMMQIQAILRGDTTTAQLAAGNAPSSPFTVPEGGVPVAGPGSGPTMVLNKQTGALELRQPQTRATVARGSDGKTYVMGPDGKPLREATADEIKRARGG